MGRGATVSASPAEVRTNPRAITNYPLPPARTHPTGARHTPHTHHTITKPASCVCGENGRSATRDARAVTRVCMCVRGPRENKQRQEEPLRVPPDRHADRAPPDARARAGRGGERGGGRKKHGPARPGRDSDRAPSPTADWRRSVAQGPRRCILSLARRTNRQQSALHYGNITSSQAPKPTCRSPATFAPHNRSLSISRASGDEYNAPLVPAGPRSCHARDASPQPTISIDQRRETSSRSVFPRAGGGVPSRRLPGSAVVAPPQLLMPSLLMPSRR